MTTAVHLGAAIDGNTTNLHLQWAYPTRLATIIWKNDNGSTLKTVHQLSSW